jgi:hypothetical protein
VEGVKPDVSVLDLVVFETPQVQLRNLVVFESPDVRLDELTHFSTGELLIRASSGNGRKA